MLPFDSLQCLLALEWTVVANNPFLPQARRFFVTPQPSPKKITLVQVLVNSVIKQKRSRTFMVHYSDRDHPLLRRLFSARILHPLPKVWSSQAHNQAGERYSVITIDYGAYVAFKGTAAEPFEPVFWPMNDADTPPEVAEELVPLDNRRSIRSIIVDRGVLDRFWGQGDDT